MLKKIRLIKISSKNFILLILLMIVVPVFLFLFGYTIFMDNFLSRKIAEVNTAKVNTYSHFFKEDIRQIEYFLGNLVANNGSLNTLQYQQSNLSKHENLYAIQEKFQDELANNTIVSALYIFSTENSIFRSDYGEEFSLDLKDQIQDYFTGSTPSFPTDNAWNLHKFENTYYLIRIFRKNSIYVAALINLNTVQNERSYAEFAAPDITPGYFIFFKDDVALTPHSELEPVGQKQIMVSRDIFAPDLTIAYLQSYTLDYWAEPSMIFLISGMLCLSLLFMLCYFITKKNYFRPLEEIITKINQVNNEDMNVPMVINSSIREFNDISIAHNNMMERIFNLKIEAYEQRVAAQDAQLQYHQLQIRPHFYLNCLKNLYGMAESGKYKEIQEMLLYLSNYLRFMFSSSESTISLQTELTNVQNYITLQQIGTLNKITLKTSMEESLSNFPIPPISILCFVENAIKYGIKLNQELMISIKAKHYQEGSHHYTNITIEDNGDGFSPEVLELLNGKNFHLLDGTGIKNAATRLRLIYRDNLMMSFYNLNGACVDLYIRSTAPAVKNKEEDFDECVNHR